MPNTLWHTRQRAGRCHNSARSIGAGHRHDSGKREDELITWRSPGGYQSVHPGNDLTEVRRARQRLLGEVRNLRRWASARRQQQCGGKGGRNDHTEPQPLHRALALISKLPRSHHVQPLDFLSDRPWKSLEYLTAGSKSPSFFVWELPVCYSRFNQTRARRWDLWSKSGP